jgi:MFS transporter, DHA1 family, multidrug resistance protein
MDIVDRDLEKAERDASPARFAALQAQSMDHHIGGENEKLERTHTASSTSSGSSSSVSTVPEDARMSRINTSRDLERHPTALSRIQTQKSQHLGTVGRTSKSRESKRALPNFGAGKPYPPPLPGIDEYVVEFDGPDDPLHPMNWPLRKKLLVAVMLGFTTLLAAFGSSIFSTATGEVAAVFGVSTEVGLLGLSLYVLGKVIVGFKYCMIC